WRRIRLYRYLRETGREMASGFQPADAGGELNTSYSAMPEQAPALPIAVNVCTVNRNIAFNGPAGGPQGDARQSLTDLNGSAGHIEFHTSGPSPRPGGARDG